MGWITGHQDFYAYDIATNTWTTLPNHPTTHYDAWAVAYNGKIYVTGEHSACALVQISTTTITSPLTHGLLCPYFREGIGITFSL
jgi:hypothetical protein